MPITDGSFFETFARWSAHIQHSTPASPPNNINRRSFSRAIEIATAQVACSVHDVEHQQRTKKGWLQLLDEKEDQFLG